MNLSHKQCNRLFAVLLVASVGSSLLQTALTTALPAIMRDLSISASTAQWLTSAYSLFMGMMVPATAFLMRRFSMRHLFLGAVGLFAFGTLVSFLSTGFPLLLLGRMLQAAGNGIILPMTQVVILTIFPFEKRGSVMGIYGLAVGGAPVVAPTLAGIIIDIWNWRAIFLVVLVVVVVDLLLSVKFMKDIGEAEKCSFDFTSMLLCSVGFSSILIGLGNINAANLLLLIVPVLIGAGALLLFCRRQMHTTQPFLDLTTLRQKEFRLAVVISMLLYAVMMAGATLIPIYIQTVMGKSATISGLIMMPGSFIMAMISPVTGKIYDRFGIRKLAVFGSAMMFLSCLAVSFVNEHTGVLYIATAYIFRLISIGCLMMPIVTWGMSGLDLARTAHGTALMTTLRTISGAFGAAIFVAIMTASTNVHHPGAVADAFGIDVAFLCTTVLSAVALLICCLWVGKAKTPSPALQA